VGGGGGCAGLPREAVAVGRLFFFWPTPPGVAECPPQLRRGRPWGGAPPTPPGDAGAPRLRGGGSRLHPHPLLTRLTGGGAPAARTRSAWPAVATAAAAASREASPAAAVPAAGSGSPGAPPTAASGGDSRGRNVSPVNGPPRGDRSGSGGGGGGGGRSRDGGTDRGTVSSNAPATGNVGARPRTRL